MENATPQKPTILNEKTMIPISAVVVIVAFSLGILIWVDKNYVSQAELEPIRGDISEIKVDVKSLLRGSYQQTIISETK